MIAIIIYFFAMLCVSIVLQMENYEILLTNLSLTVIIIVILGVLIQYVCEILTPKNWESILYFLDSKIKNAISFSLIFFVSFYLYYVCNSSPYFFAVFDLKTYAHYGMFSLWKKKMFMVKQYDLIITRDYSTDLMKVNSAKSSLRDTHPFYMDIIKIKEKFFLVNVTYTTSNKGIIESTGLDALRQYVGNHTKTGKPVYIVADDPVMIPINSQDDFDKNIRDLTIIYKDKIVTGEEFFAHQAVRNAIKVRNADVEFITPLSQTKQEFLDTIEAMKANAEFMFIDTIKYLNDKKD